MVVGSRQADQKAFEQLYRRFYAALLGLIDPIINDPVEAQNLVQNTFVNAWLHFNQYDPERGRLISWLLKIARNKALDCIRRRTIIRLSPLTEGSYTTNCAKWVV